MTWRPMASAAAALIAVSLPVFLLGALSSRIGPDLGMTEAGIGLAIGAFFAAAALAAIPGGRVVDRIGAVTALRLGVTIGAVSLAAVGTVVDRSLLLVLALLVAGAALGLVDPGGARALSMSLPADRQGIGFGVKEASIPAASLAAGATLPLVAGWRPAFVVAAVIAAVVAAAIRLEAATPAPASTAPHESAGTAPAPPHALAAIAIASGLGGGAAAVTATFLIPSALSGGWSPGVAAAVLMVASCAAIVVRLSAGRLADRVPGRELWLVTIGLGVGTIGLIGLAAGALPSAPWVSTAALPVAAVLAIGGGWGWTGLAFLAAIRVTPQRPAHAAGAVLTGLGAGGAAGPIAFGVAVTTVGYAIAWAGAALVMAVAGVVAGVSARARDGSRPSTV